LSTEGQLNRAACSSRWIIAQPDCATKTIQDSARYGETQTHSPRLRGYKGLEKLVGIVLAQSLSSIVDLNNYRTITFIPNNLQSNHSTWRRGLYGIDQDVK
jgi:hypothetical protein